MPDQLTAKQEQFALLAVQPGSTLSGAYRAAYDAKNMNPNTIYRTAHELATNSKITARMAELRALAADRALVSVQQVLERLALIAFTDINALGSWDEHGNLTLKPSDQLSPEALATIKSVKRNAAGELTVELESRTAALIAIGKHLGMFPTRVEQTGLDGGPIDVRVVVGYLDRLNLSDEQLATLSALTEAEQGG